MNPWIRVLAGVLRNPRARSTVTRVAMVCALLIAGVGVTAFFVITTLLGEFMSTGQTPGTGEYCLSAASTQQATGQWSAEQVTNAATIVRVGQADHVSVYGQVIAVATAMQEAGLVNLNYGDRDSVGLFQQRPSQGWGTPAQIMDPVYSSNAFYQHLKQVPNWQSDPLTVAAQAVQNSGFPDAYAKWQQAATALVAHLTGTSLTAATSAGGGGCLAGTIAQRSPLALRAVLAYAEAAIGTMYDYGGSCTDPHSSNMLLRCDCSSLVQQSFAQAGLNLPRTAEAQWEWGEAGHAQVIPLDQAELGDVVYMPSYLGPDTIGHTGIVINPKKMIMLDAPETGKPVGYGSYAPANDPYGSHMLTILRFISLTSGGGSA